MLQTLNTLGLDPQQTNLPSNSTRKATFLHTTASSQIYHLNRHMHMTRIAHLGPGKAYTELWRLEPRRNGALPSVHLQHGVIHVALWPAELAADGPCACDVRHIPAHAHGGNLRLVTSMPLGLQGAADNMGRAMQCAKVWVTP